MTTQDIHSYSFASIFRDRNSCGFVRHIKPFISSRVSGAIIAFAQTWASFVVWIMLGGELLGCGTSLILTWLSTMQTSHHHNSFSYGKICPQMEDSKHAWLMKMHTRGVCPLWHLSMYEWGIRVVCQTSGSPAFSALHFVGDPWTVFYSLDGLQALPSNKLVDYRGPCHGADKNSRSLLCRANSYFELWITILLRFCTC
jgi:hypothetical protein